MFVTDVSLCVGVGKDKQIKIAHLVDVERPNRVSTFPWQSGEHFETGCWYREIHIEDKQSIKTKKCWRKINEVIPTNLIRAGERLTLLEVSLPIFFAKDFELFSTIKMKFNNDIIQKPVCPLFGQDSSIKILDLPVNGFVDKNGRPPTAGTMYSIQFRPYSECGSSYFRRNKLGSGASKNENSNSTESLNLKNRKEEYEARREYLKKIIESKEKAKYEENKSSNPIKTSSRHSSVFSTKHSYKLQQEKPRSFSNRARSEERFSKQLLNEQQKVKQQVSLNKFSTYGQFKPQNLLQNIQEDINQNKHQDIFQQQNKQQNIFENTEQEVDKQNINPNKHSFVSLKEQYDFFYETYKNGKFDALLQNINQNKQQNKDIKLKQKFQPKPVTKCFNVQKTKTSNVENLNSSTASSSTLKLSEANQDEASAKNLSLFDNTLNSPFNENLTNNVSNINNSSVKSNFKQKQHLFSGDNLYQKNKLPDGNEIATEFSSLNVSGEKQINKILDEEPGGFGYSRRCRSVFGIKTTNQLNFGQQQQQQEIENPFKTFQFKFNNFGKENTIQNVDKNKNEEKVEENENSEIDEALTAELTDDEKYDDNEEVFDYQEDEEEVNNDDYVDFSYNFGGSQTIGNKPVFPKLFSR